MRMTPSPVIELNHAVAVAMADGPERGLLLLAKLERAHVLHHYYPLYAAQADLLRRANRLDDARTAYTKALELCQNEIERAFFRRCLAECADGIDYR
jgi:RNA polymerase sigma-70 factor (ECF subfamily)